MSLRKLTVLAATLGLSMAVLTGCQVEQVPQTTDTSNLVTKDELEEAVDDCCKGNGESITDLVGEDAVSEEGITVKPENPKWTVTIPGNNGSLCNIPTFIAYEKGFLAAEGIDATLVAADFETKKVGLNEGTMPVVNGDFMYFPSIETGLNITVVDGMHKGCIRIQVLPDSDIKSAEDLRGKKIACDEIGGTPYQVATLWLANGGVNAIGDKAEVDFLPFSDDNLSVEALKKGEVDAIAIWDPVAASVEKSGEVKTILDIGSDDDFRNHYCCYLYASTKVLEEDPELIEALVRAYQNAEDYIAKNAEAATKLILETGYVTIEDWDLAVDLVSGYGYEKVEDREAGRTIDVKEDVKYFATALNKVGYLESDPDEYIEKAYTKVDIK